jgi:hypothetical protein
MQAVVPSGRVDQLAHGGAQLEDVLGGGMVPALVDCEPIMKALVVGVARMAGVREATDKKRSLLYLGRLLMGDTTDQV